MIIIFIDLPCVGGHAHPHLRPFIRLLENKIPVGQVSMPDISKGVSVKC